MWHIREAIVVEGRYDTVRLSSVVDTVIVQTNGFRIFQDKDQLAMLRQLARTRGLVVLTDSDAAGFLIRDHIASVIPKEQIKHAYIPPVEGKESRKRTPSKEGLLGVEGMSEEAILTALKTAGVVPNDGNEPQTPYATPLRFYEDGLTGGEGSREKRKRLCRALSLPTHLSSSRLMAILNTAYTEEEYQQALSLTD